MQTFKTAYFYCPTTGRFLNEVLCFYAPEQKKYPLPPYATFLPPPSPRFLFDGKVWHTPDPDEAGQKPPLNDRGVFDKLTEQHPLEDLVEALLLYIIGRPKKLLEISLLFHQLEEGGLSDDR